MALFGGNPEDMDAETALAAFLAAFRTEDKKLRAVAIAEFVRGFKQLYTSSRKTILEMEESHKCYMNLVYDHVIDSKFIAEGGYSLSFEGVPLPERVRKLGEMLGAFLAFIDYYVSSTDQKVQNYIDQSMANYGNIYEITLGRINTLSSVLKKANVSIKKKFIANGIRQIARKKARKLTANQQKLLSEIAAIFW